MAEYCEGALRALWALALVVNVQSSAHAQSDVTAIDGKVFGAHTVERGELATKHVVAPGEQSRTVERPQIRYVLHHTDAFLVALGIGADAARVLRIDIAAAVAFDKLVANRAERIENLIERGLTMLHQPQHRPPRGTRPKAGKAGQGGCEVFDLLRCHHSPDRATRDG